MIIISLFLIFWIIFGYICFAKSLRRRPSDSGEKESLCGGGDVPLEVEAEVRACRTWLDGMGGEDIYKSTPDRLVLHSRLICPLGKAKGTVIFAHGYHSSCRRDLAVQIKATYNAGYRVLLMSQRGHGKSQGKCLTMGVREREDMLMWAEYIAERFPSEPIALMGLSMGASTVMCASSLPLPANVRCLVADCGFTSPFDIIVNTLRYEKHIIPYPTVYFMDMWCRILGKFKLRGAEAYVELQKNTRPLLMFHGELDRYVPTEMSVRNRSVCQGNCELVIIQGAKHSQSVYYGRDGYLNKLLDFFEQNMGA